MSIISCRARRLPSSFQGPILSLSWTNATVRTCLGKRSFAQTIRTASTGNSISHGTPQSKAPPPKVLTRGLPPPKIQEFRESQFRPSGNGTQAWNARYIAALSQTTEPMLLYKSPSHGSFFALSYSMGLILFVGAYSWALFAVKDREGETTSPWYVRTMSIVPTACLVVFGSTFFFAPTKLIRSISLMAPKIGTDGVVTNGPRKLQFEVKHMLPFFKPYKQEFETTRVFLDRNVTTVQDISFHSVPLSEAQSFTSSFFADTLHSKPKRSILDQISAANRSMVDAWPAFSRDVRRMFLRDQMAYITVTGNGNFKMDLQGCHLLDNGRLLEAVTIPDENARLGWLGRFQQIFRG